MVLVSETGNPLANFGDETSAAQVIATLDPADYANGDYRLELAAEDASGNHSTTQIIVRLEGSVDLGQLVVGFEDLTVPVRGFPITVNRVYDSSESGEIGDFGYGWNLELTGIELETVHPEGTREANGLPVFRDGSRVIIELPDGTREGFTFVPQPASGSLINPLSREYVPLFVADRGNTSELALGSNLFTYLEKTGDGTHYRVFDGPQSGTFFNPANPSLRTAYVLTLRNGTELTFDGVTGEVVVIEDRESAYAFANGLPPAGERLEITPFGIQSSAGRSVQFIRDNQGRITRIIDPQGGELNYSYDANGNLESFSDRTDNTTQFQYHQQDIHFLETIVDPLGRSAVRTYYDQQGRIDRVLDADNQLLDHQWNGSGNTLTTLEVVDDADDPSIKNAIQTVTEFDLEENPIRIETVLLRDVTVTYDSDGDGIADPGADPGTSIPVSVSGGTADGLSEITLRQYNSRNLVTQETIVIGAEDTDGGENDDLTTIYVYNSDFDLVRTLSPRHQTNPDLFQDSTRYNDFGQPTTIIDQFGNVTTNRYDSQTGDLLSTSSPNSDTRFRYDDDGNLESVVDNRTGQQLVFNRYNQFGDVIQTTDANGFQTFFQYDDLGNQTQSWRIETFDHDFNPDTPEKRYEFRTTTVYDAESRVTETVQTKTDVTDPDNRVTLELSRSDSNNKNALGQDIVTSSTNSQSNGQDAQSVIVYDSRGLAIESRRSAFGSDGSEVWFASRTVYDSKGRVTYSTNEYLADADGNPLLAIEDIYGSHSVYDVQGRAVRTQRLRGVNIAIDGTDNFQQANLVAAGEVISHSTTVYDNAGRIQSTTSFNTDSTNPADGLTTSYTYNQFGETIEVRSESFNADGTGKVVMVSYTVYDDFGRAFFSVEPWLEGGPRPAFATETLYDAQGRAYSTVRYEGVQIDIVDGQTVITDRGQTLYSTLTTFDDRGRVESSTAADGQVTRYEYDDLGRRVATIGAVVVIDGIAQRHRTETVYDSRGRVSIERAGMIHNGIRDGVHDESGVQETRFSYDENGNVTRTTFDDGSFAQVRYDELGRRIAESQQVAAETQLVWSEDDQSFVDTRFADGDTQRIVQTRLLSYDSQGRLAGVTLPILVGSSERANYQYGYDAWGQQTSIIDPLGRETTLVYDQLGRQTARQLPLHTADNPFEETFGYDQRQRQSLQVSFEGVYMVPVYDDVTGRMVATHYFVDADSYNDGDGTPDEIRNYFYDDYGRQIRIEFYSVAGDGTQTLTRTEDMAYDDRSQLEFVSTDEGVIRYRYDDLGRQTEVASGRNVDFQSATDDDFENITRYTYDELGRLETVSSIKRGGHTVDIDTATTGDQADTTTYQYDLIGNLDETIYSNGLVHDYEYDALNRLESLTHFIDTNGNGTLDGGEQLRATFDYEVRADGKRTSATEQFFIDNDNVADQANEFTYDYDELGRLIGEALDSTEDDLDYVDLFAYDLVGNRSSTTRDWGDDTKDDYTTTYEYDSNDRLLTETKDYVDDSVPDETTTYGYDQTQQTSKTLESDDVTTSTQTFAYDLQGRLFRSTTIGENGTTSVEYDYDSAGNRIKSIATAADGTVTTTEYLTDSRNHTGYSQVLQETQLDANGNVIKTIVYAIGHDQISQTVTDAENPDGITHYFGTDGHGSVRVLYDLVAAVVQDAAGTQQLYHFDAYGNLLNFADGITPLTSYLYSGEAFDFNIGQQYLRARFYDPSSGRFNRLDPFFGNLEDPQSLHKYAYVHGDPISNIDPTGKFSAPQALATIAIAIPLVSGTLNYIQAARYSFNRQYELAAIFSLLGHIDIFTAASAALTGGGGGGAAGAAVVTAGGALAVRRIILAEAIEFGVRNYGTLVGVSLAGLAAEAIAAMTRYLFSVAGGSGGAPGNFEHTDGPGEWRSGAETLRDAPARFQQQVSGKPRGWIYWLRGKKFDAFRRTAGELIDAKSASGNNFYVRALTDSSLRRAVERSGAYRGLIDDIINQRNIAVQEGLQFVIEVETDQMRREFTRTLTEESVTGVLVRVAS